jgi:membrane associated rhomboid family serine protease
MIIPISTDAPIYHFPKATLGVIASNIAIHVLWSFQAPAAAEPYALKLGAGLHPLQWLTHNFLHADFLHLGGNMIFLWAYGIIVEGKIGWWRLLLCYLSIGTLHGAAIQAAYLHSTGDHYVLGASAIIFGLMAMAMIWAPVNDLSCFYLFFVGFRILSGVFEVPIYAFALLQLFLEGLSVVLMYMIQGDPMSSGFLHISGAFWGLLTGILVVKAGWVDCEGWDVFALLDKRRALRKAWQARGERLDRSKQHAMLPKTLRAEEDAPRLSPEERAAKLLGKIHRSIEMGDVATAEASYRKWIALVGDRAPRDVLLGIIRELHKQEEWAASVPPMRALCKLHPAKSEKVRLKLATILIRKLDRPTEALKHLRQIPDDCQDRTLRALQSQLLKESTRMIDDGVLEVEEEA